MMKPILALLCFVLVPLVGPLSAKAADCDILKNKCGKTKEIEIKGNILASAVQLASEYHGKLSYSKIRGNCNVSNDGARVNLPPVVTSPQTCEIKLLTGGKSHSKMRKRCAFSKWSIYGKTRQLTDGLGGKWVQRILKRPKKNTRQKMWHVKLSANRPPIPLQPSAHHVFAFSIKSVKMKVPSSFNLPRSEKGEALRNYCFK